MKKLPPRYAARIFQHQLEVLETAATWDEPVGLLFWDLWGERLHADIRAWERHVVESGRIAIKVFEDGRLHEEKLLDMPGWEKERFDDDGKVLVLRKTGAGTVEKVEADYPPGTMPAGAVPATAFWIVDGERYAREAVLSRASVKRHMPDLDTEIYTPEKREHTDWFTEDIRLLVKVMEAMPIGDRLLWLDSDTYMVEPVPELLDVLDRYDMALAHAPGHVTGETADPIPAAFPEFNIGVIAMRNTEEVRNVWRAVYAKMTKRHGYTDQSALREELWDTAKWELPYAVIPWEYNCRFLIGTFIRDRVKILHGRAESPEQYERIAQHINKQAAKGRGDSAIAP
jgi:hypothetical protein